MGFSIIGGLTWHLHGYCGVVVSLSYLLFLNRIKETFTYSVYEPSTCTLIYLYILLGIFGIAWMIANVVPFLLLFPNYELTRQTMDEIEFYSLIPVIIIDIILTLSMASMFVSRLYKLLLVQISQNPQSRCSSKGVPLLLTLKHENLIQISVKITILTVTCLLSAILLVGFKAIVNFVVAHKAPHQAVFMSVILSFWINIDVIIRCLCFILFLPGTEKGFRFLCCCCIRILSNCIKKSLLYETVEYNVKQKSVAWMPLSLPTSSPDNTSNVPLGTV